MLDQVRHAVEALLDGAERARVDLDRFLWLDLSRGALDGCGWLFFAPDGTGPTVVAKASRSPARQAAWRLDEANLRTLETAGLNARQRRAPRSLGLREEGTVLVTLQTALPGQLLRNLPAREIFGPRRAADTIERACAWLGELEAAFGVRRRTLDDDAYDAVVLALVRRFLRRYRVGPAEADFLRRRFEQERRLAGPSLPLSVAHGDFCPANLVLDAAGVAAFDWEHPLEHGLPLYDLLFFFASTRFPFGGLRRESSYAESMTAVYWGDGYLSRALATRLREACGRLDIAPELVGDLFLLAILLRADRKYDTFTAAADLSGEPADADDAQRRWRLLRAFERDAPLHWVRDGEHLGLRQVVERGLPPTLSALGG